MIHYEIGTLVSALILNVIAKEHGKISQVEIAIGSKPELDDDHALKWPPLTSCALVGSLGKLCLRPPLSSGSQVSKATQTKTGDVLLMSS